MDPWLVLSVVEDKYGWNRGDGVLLMRDFEGKYVSWSDTKGVINPRNKIENSL